jgi:CRP/FNR family transcriptional regulator
MFAELNPAEMEALAAIAVPRSYEARQALFHEGEPCEGVFVIASGRVRIVKTTASGRQIVLAVETAPSTVAEVPVFDGGPYPASVEAMEPSTAFLIHRQDLQRLLLRNPETALKLLAVVGLRLRRLVALVEGVTFGSVRQRLAALLLETAEAAGEDSFALPGTHEELAVRLGTVREVVSRNLGRFQSAGLIRLDRRTARVLDPEGLRREAQTEL